MEGEWSCYERWVNFNGGRMVMLQMRWWGNFMEGLMGHVTEVVFNGGSMVMLQRSIMEGE